MSNAAGGSRFPALTTRYDFKTADNKGLLQLHGLAHENRVAPKIVHLKKNLAGV